MGIDDRELACWVAFSRVPGFGASRIRRLKAYFGSLAEAWRAPRHQLLAAGLEPALADQVEAPRRRGSAADLERRRPLGFGVVHWDDPDYPERLRVSDDPPAVLFVKGDVVAIRNWAVAVVGTRRPTYYGREVARTLGRDLAASGVTVVSGLAAGIDTEAHRGALEAGGWTVAVLGCGLDQVYPPQNRDLARRIADSGALISEFPPGTPPAPQNFPIRNRIISGLSLGVVVVEADEHSGALITAGYAAEQGREVFAVPGPVTSPQSRGTNRLIQDGAGLITGAHDVLEALKLARLDHQIELRQAAPETELELILVKLLDHTPTHIDDLVRQAGKPAGEVGATLALLELKGLVRHVGGQYYVRG